MFTVGSVADSPVLSINKRTPKSPLAGKVKTFLGISLLCCFRSFNNVLNIINCLWNLSQTLHAQRLLSPPTFPHGTLWQMQIGGCNKGCGFGGLRQKWTCCKLGAIVGWLSARDGLPMSKVTQEPVDNQTAELAGSLLGLVFLTLCQMCSSEPPCQHMGAVWGWLCPGSCPRIQRSLFCAHWELSNVCLDFGKGVCVSNRVLMWRLLPSR